MSRNKIYSIIYFIIGLLIILIPAYLFPVCPLETMHCRTVTLPALIVLGAATMVVAGVQFLTE